MRPRFRKPSETRDRYDWLAKYEPDVGHWLDYTVSPEVAREWLGAQLISADKCRLQIEWIENGCFNDPGDDPPMLDIEGDLHVDNGVHRLSAIVHTGQPQRFKVIEVS